MTTPTVSIAARLKRIREAYVKQIPAQLEGIRAALETFSEKPHFEELQALHRAIHTLRGASASFGLSRLSAVAAVGEYLAKEAMQAEPLPYKRLIVQMQAQLDLVEREATNLESAQTADLQALDLVAASENTDGREQKVVYLCEDDSFQRMALSTQIGCFGFQIIAFGDLEQLYQAVKNSPPDAIVMDMMYSRRPTGGADMVARIQSEREIPIPTVFISSQDDFAHRLSAVRAGSSAYFVKPVNATDLSATLTTLTTVDKPEPYRVMIVEDDTHLLELYATILQGVGMVTMEIDDPLLVMENLSDFKPDLILTDMNMPGCDGMELAKTIRQSGDCFSIPIVFLSSETDTDLHRNAMRMGGDEFLTKPIKPEHLISAVAVRAERMKVIRSFMIRDGMTGLFNHSAVKERLGTAIAEAGRTGGDLCFAMIDMDLFKKINDGYGHPTGDRVLIALARFLRHRVRKTDLVGRYGGEEFAIIFAGCDLPTAKALLDQLRENFSAIQFPAGGESFSATFSCGVAALSSHTDAERLCKAADEALYEAKKQGRNRVEAG